MPFSPIAGTNIDYASPIEALSALQRNPQISRAIVNGVLSASFTGSVIYAILADSGSVIVTDTTAAYKVVGPGSAVFPFGAPTLNPPSGGSLVATVSTTTVFATVLYK